jgi:hypothetical protein
MALDRYILKGYDLSGGNNNWTSDSIPGYASYTVEYIWSNVTGTLDGELVVRETDDDIVYDSIKTTTVSVANKTHIVSNVNLTSDKINVKFTANGITGGRLSIRIKGTERTSLIGNIYAAATDAIISLGSISRRFKDLYLSRELRIGSGNDVAQIKNGNILFFGNTGMAFGEITVNGNTTQTAISSSGQNNKVQFALFDTNSPAINIAPDHTQNHIVIERKGIYFVSSCIHADSVSGAGARFGFSIYKNNGTTEITNLHFHRDFSGGGSEAGAGSICGLGSFNVGDTIELWVWNESNSQNIILSDIGIFLLQIGG